MRSKSFSRSPFLETARSLDARTLISLIVHLPNFIRLFVRLMRDRRVPFHLKLLVYGAILYFLSPIDLVPELRALGFGYVDDVVLLFLAFRALVRGSPPEVVQEHVEAISGYRRETGENRDQKGRREPRNVTPRAEDRAASR